MPLHNNYLIRLDLIDILVYENGMDFIAVKTAIEMCKQIPKELLKDKNFRVSAFELSLKSTGQFK